MGLINISMKGKCYFWCCRRPLPKYQKLYCFLKKFREMVLLWLKLSRLQIVLRIKNFNQNEELWISKELASVHFFHMVYTSCVLGITKEYPWTQNSKDHQECWHLDYKSKNIKFTINWNMAILHGSILSTGCSNEVRFGFSSIPNKLPLIVGKKKFISN